MTEKDACLSIHDFSKYFLYKGHFWWKNHHIVTFVTSAHLCFWIFNFCAIFSENYISLASRATLFHENSWEDIECMVFWIYVFFFENNEKLSFSFLILKLKNWKKSMCRAENAWCKIFPIMSTNQGTHFHKS